VEAITGELKYVHIIDQDKCTKCGQCLEVCPPKIGAVKKITGNDLEELEQLSEIVLCAERRKQ
jgi:NADH-quinone oxidoreductase subunit F